MLVADRQGRILQPRILLWGAGGGVGAGRRVVRQEFVLVGAGLVRGVGRRAGLLGKSGRDESCSGVSSLWAKMRSYPRMWNLFV